MARPGRERGGGLHYLSVVDVSKSFQGFKALEGVSLAIGKGEFVCFLGPSGCGKTTLLRCIAGLERVDCGRIIQDGRDITRLPPAGRDFGIVFQSYALFPNLTVTENIGFGLVSLGQRRDVITERVRELVAITGLCGHEAKYPAQLSGGQQQRVALARALAPGSGLLLLDEPLSALDAKVRAHLRREVKKIHRRLGLTTIMVTHDQEEALTMADRIVVMRAGAIEQTARPAEVYDNPATSFVAAFVGAMNLLDAVVIDRGAVRCGQAILGTVDACTPPGTPVLCAFRPEHVALTEVGAGGENGFEAEIVDVENLGSISRLYLQSPLGATEISADALASQAGQVRAEPGVRVGIRIPPGRIRLYPREAGT